MNDGTAEQPDGSAETQRALKEAVERQMRLQAWPSGLLAGGPPLSEAVKPWHQGFAIYNGPAEPFAEYREVAEDSESRIGEQLMAACFRIRERRTQSGEPPIDLPEEERRRRLREVVESFETRRQAGEEFTPMHIALAARYIEGWITLEAYRSRS